MNLRLNWQLAASLLGLVVLVLGVFGVVRQLRPDKELVRVQEMQQKLRGEDARSYTLEERRELRQQLDQEVKKLSPQQRRQLFQEQMRKRAEELDRFFTLPPTEQSAHLDAEIAKQEARRKQREEANKQGTGNQSSDGTASGGGPTRGGGSDEQRLQRRKEMLDWTTPEQRATFTAYRRAMQERRQQQGLGNPSPARGQG
jgi:TolA-binding protein